MHASPREALVNTPVHRSKTAAIKTLPTADPERGHAIPNYPTPMKLPSRELRKWEPSSPNGFKNQPSPSYQEQAASVKHKSVKSMKKSKSGRTETRLRSASTVDLSSAVGKSAFASVTSPLHASAVNLSQASSNLQQASSMAKSLSNISCLSLVKDSTLVVNDSQLSVAKSSECLAAPSVTSAEQRRAAKLAFMHAQHKEAAASKARVDERLKSSKIGRSSLSQTPKRASTRSLRSASCSSLNAQCNMVAFKGVAANSVGTEV